MILNSPYISGSLTVTGNITAQGGINISGSIASASFALSASEASKLQGLGSSSFAPAATFNTVSQSYAASSASLSTRVTTNETNISTLTSASSSFATMSGSLSTRVTNVETTASVLTSASSSFATMSGSLSTRVTNLEVTSSTVSQSFASTSGSISGRVTLIEGQYATTGSNNFTGPQFISQASNAISFTSTASLYTNGGLRVSKDSYVSGTAYFNNVVVYGTSSIQYITSSQVNFGTNIITVNTDTPAVRFGGLAVFDSGSTQLTGSILWDSEKNNWIYSNPSGSTYNSAMLMNGPRNTGSLGTEQGTTACAMMIGQGGDHITSSAIFSYGNATCFYGNTVISSSGTICTAMGNFACVGIGTTTPANAFNVSNNGASGFEVSPTGGINSGVLLQAYNRSTSAYMAQSYYACTHTFNVGTSGGTRALDITAGGSVGIGTTSPDIFGRGDGFDVGISSAGVGSTQNMSLQLNAGATAGRGAQLYMGQGGTRHFTISSNATESTIGTTSNTPLRFVTCDSLERLRFSNTGIACFACQVCTPSMDIMPSGIGSSTLGGIMRVVTTGTSTGIAVGQSNANRYTHIAANDIQVFNDDFFLSTRCAFPLSIGTCYTARLTFAATGIACFACQVCLPTSNTSLVAGTYGTISNVGGIDTNIGNNAYYDGTNWRRFAAQEAARIYINRDSFSFLRKASDGAGSCISWDNTLFLASTGIACFACQVCLATRLVVQGGGNSIFPWSDALDGQPGMFAVSCIGSAISGLYAKVYGPSVNAGIFGTNTQCVAFIGTEGDCNKGLIIGTINSAPIYIGTSNSNRLVISSTGIACFTCQICTPAGVKFGNGSGVLNYYETGTFTPCVSISGMGAFYSNRAGSYIRVGNLVTAQIYLAVCLCGSYTNSFFNVTNLPFAVSSEGAVEEYAASFWQVNAAGVQSIGAVTQRGTTSIGFACRGTNGGMVAALNPTADSTVRDLNFTITYKAS